MRQLSYNLQNITSSSQTQQYNNTTTQKSFVKLKLQSGIDLKLTMKLWGNVNSDDKKVINSLKEHLFCLKTKQLKLLL